MQEVSSAISKFYKCFGFICSLFGYCTLMDCTVQVPGKTGGPPEKKEVLLEDHDPVWLELRHAHIADVFLMFIPYMCVCVCVRACARTILTHFE